MSRPLVQVILGCGEANKALHNALRRLNAAVCFSSLEKFLAAGPATAADAAVLVAPRNPKLLHTVLAAAYDRLAERPTPALVLHAKGTEAPKPVALNRAPVSFATFGSTDALTARIGALLEAGQVMRRGGGAKTTGAGDADLARGNEDPFGGLIPACPTLSPAAGTRARLPRAHGEAPARPIRDGGEFSFRKLYRPAEYVSGDVYDVRRLDEEHIGVTVLDATGHGVSAALLSMFVKRALNAAEAETDIDCAARPDRVLARLNEELCAAELSDCRFVAAIYAVLNTRTREVLLARGGAPYPLLRHGDGTLETLESRGPLVGVVPDARFELVSVTLGRGDSLLLHSDGLDMLVDPPPTRDAMPTPQFGFGMDRRLRLLGDAANASDAAPESATATAEAAELGVTTTAWAGYLRQAGVSASLDALATRHELLRRLGRDVDDLTVVSIECGVDETAPARTISAQSHPRILHLPIERGRTAPLAASA